MRKNKRGIFRLLKISSGKTDCFSYFGFVLFDIRYNFLKRFKVINLISFEYVLVFSVVNITKDISNEIITVLSLENTLIYMEIHRLLGSKDKFKIAYWFY